MTEWLGISHLFELSTTEAVAAFFTPLAIFVAFFVVQLILPGKRVPGYVINPETGEPRNYRLNGIIVFAIALIVWGFELTGMPRDWFYRATIFAVAGGTFFAFIFSLIAFFTNPPGNDENIFLAFWHGRPKEISFFNGRIDVKMWFYVVGGTMLSLNAMSGVAYNYELHGDNFNPGVFLYAAFWTIYVLDYFIFERLMLYTYDVIYERLGFKLFWGALIVYGWVYILPLWGMAPHPDPGFASPWNYVVLIAAAAIFLAGMVISRGANLQKYVFKTSPDRKFLGLIQPKYIRAGDRKILHSGFWGASRHFNYAGEWFLGLSFVVAFGYFANPWAWLYLVWAIPFFIWRQIDDDRLCAEKYGEEKWAEYRSKVKYRILPGIY